MRTLIVMLPLLLAGLQPALAQDPAPPAAAATTAAPATTEPAAPAAADYALKATSSTLFVVVYKDPNTLGAGFAHDHAIAATGWTGKVHWNPSNVAECKIDISVPVSGLKVDPPGFRQKAGINLADEVDADDKAEITSNFQGSSQLDMAKYTTIGFQSTSCAQSGDKVEVSGNMTIRGKARPTKVLMAVTTDGTTLKASGRFDANHTDWGFNPFSAALGAVKNQNKLTFVMDLVGSK